MAACATIANWFVLALTPVERWQAARRLDNSFWSERWFVIVGIFALVFLAGGYIYIEIQRRKNRSGPDVDSFTVHAERRGLSSRENQILLYVSKMAGLKHPDTIFTMQRAFEYGSSTMISEVIADGEMSAERIEELKADLNALREKLGFQQGHLSSDEAGRAGIKPTSRKIPEGKTLYITRRAGREGDEIETTVVKNSRSDFCVRVPMEIYSSPGEQWQVRYFYGASVWEFDARVLSSDGDVLVFEHSEKIRFINRRRFLRVSVEGKAYLATFPFEKEGANPQKKASSGDSDSFGLDAFLPQFVPAAMKELAGPGLRLESSLELEVNDRVVVVFELESGKEQQQDSQEQRGFKRIAQSVGEVRHVEKIEDVFSIAIELTGLDDSDINELIRATNAASMLACGHNDKENNALQVKQNVAITT